jgi:hypothetical protein
MNSHGILQSTTKERHVVQGMLCGVLKLDFTYTLHNSMPDLSHQTGALSANLRSLLLPRLVAKRPGAETWRYQSRTLQTFSAPSIFDTEMVPTVFTSLHGDAMGHYLCSVEALFHYEVELTYRLASSLRSCRFAMESLLTSDHQPALSFWVDNVVPAEYLCPLTISILLR